MNESLTQTRTQRGVLESALRHKGRLPDIPHPQSTEAVARKLAPIPVWLPKKPSHRTRSLAETKAALKELNVENAIIAEETQIALDKFDDYIGQRIHRVDPSFRPMSERLAEEDLELKRMGIKQVKPQRPPSPRQFYDYAPSRPVTAATGTAGATARDRAVSRGKISFAADAKAVKSSPVTASSESGMRARDVMLTTKRSLRLQQEVLEGSGSHGDHYDTARTARSAPLSYATMCESMFLQPNLPEKIVEHPRGFRFYKRIELFDQTLLQPEEKQVHEQIVHTLRTAEIDRRREEEHQRTARLSERRIRERAAHQEKTQAHFGQSLARGELYAIRKAAVQRVQAEASRRKHESTEEKEELAREMAQLEAFELRLLRNRKD